MHKKFIVGGLVVAIVGVISATAAFASSDSYKFVARGNVTAVDRANNTVTMATKHASAEAVEDLAGSNVEFNVKGAKVYKWVNGKKVRVTLGGVPVGHEVVLEGAKRSEGRFNVSKITVNDNTFTIVGVLQNKDSSNKTLKVEVSYTSYKSSIYKDKTITLYYGGNTKFYTREGSEINVEDFTENDQRIKMTGTVTGGSKWEVLKLWDNYPKAQ
jgi:hypothetical protein